MGIIKKERIIIFKQLRKRITELKEDFFEAKSETEVNVLNYFNLIVISIITLLNYFIAVILYFLNFRILFAIITILAFTYLILALSVGKVFRLTGRISYKLLFYLFGRYGKVVGSKDWKNIKKYCKRKFYKEACTRKSRGYCYFYSWAIAQFLEEAQLMYCSIVTSKGLTGHSVIMKDHWIYDTNMRRHYNYDQYIEIFKVTVYAIFSPKEYRTESFFKDIRPGFVAWCAENNVYCNPQ